MSLFRCTGASLKGLMKLYAVNESISVPSLGITYYYFGISSLSIQVPSGYGIMVYVYDNFGNLIHTENMQDYNLHTFSITSNYGTIKFTAAGSTSVTIKSISYN